MDESEEFSRMDEGTVLACIVVLKWGKVCQPLNFNIKNSKKFA